eukprot:3191045-Ditylum_brightwellii.AAC.1
MAPLGIILGISFTYHYTERKSQEAFLLRESLNLTTTTYSIEEDYDQDDDGLTSGQGSTWLAIIQAVNAAYHPVP